MIVFYKCHSLDSGDTYWVRLRPHKKYFCFPSSEILKSDVRLQFLFHLSLTIKALVLKILFFSHNMSQDRMFLSHRHPKLNKMYLYQSSKPNESTLTQKDCWERSIHQIQQNENIIYLETLLKSDAHSVEKQKNIYMA